MNPNLIPCPYCCSPGHPKFVYAGKNYFHCHRCDLIFSPLSKEDVEASIRHYRDCYYDASADDQLSPPRLEIHEKILDLLEKAREPGTLLDVGCGRGAFLRAAARRGWAAQGIDPSLDSIREAATVLKGCVFCTTLNDFDPPGIYEVVTMINVLDHLPDVRQAVTRAAALLQDGGFLYLRVPNALFHTSLFRLASTARILWPLRRFCIFHQCSLTPRFLRGLIHDAGLTTMTIKNAPLAGGYRSRGADAASRPAAVLDRSVYAVARLGEIISRGWILIGPSLEVLAAKDTDRNR